MIDIVNTPQESLNDEHLQEVLKQQFMLLVKLNEKLENIKTMLEISSYISAEDHNTCERCEMLD